MAQVTIGEKATHCSFFCLSQHYFEFGENLFDWIEVGAVWRQEPGCCARRFDPFAHRYRLWLDRLSMMTTSPGRSRARALGDIGIEPVAVDRTVQHHRRDHTCHAQPRNQRGRFAMAMREAHAQAFALGAAAMAAGHVGRGPGFVDEHETFGFQIDLTVEPVVPLLQDVGPVLLDAWPVFFCASCHGDKEAVKPGHRDGQDYLGQARA
jgi:hypothetical protein